MHLRPCRLTERTARGGEAKIVVVEHLLALGLHADRPGMAEVEHGAVHGLDDAGGNQLVVDGQIGTGRQHQPVIKDARGAAIVEVEIGVVREIAQRRLLRSRGQFDRQRAGDLEAIGAGRVESAGKAHVAIRRMQGESHEVRAMQGDLPYALAEALGAAMQRVLAEEIPVRLIAHSGDDEAAVPDAIGIAAGDRAHIRRVGGIVVECFEAEDQRRLMAGKAQVLQDRAPVHHGGGEPAARDHEALDGFAVRCRAETLAVHLLPRPKA